MPPGDGSQSEVASFTDAWIETVTRSTTGRASRVASFTDAWIETKRTPVALNQKDSRIFYRCVD